MRSQVSCFACRTSKRRCDKRYPACSLCLRRGIECHFPTHRGDRADPQPSQRTNWAPTPDSSDSQTGASGISPAQPASVLPVRGSVEGFHEPRKTEGSYHSALPFLVPELLPVHVVPDHHIPSTVLDALGTSTQMRDSACQFFVMTQHYFPVVARKRYLASLLSSTGRTLSLGLALLTLAMKLMTITPTDDESTLVYKILRSALSDAQCTSSPHLQLLQASLILGLYEISHAMFPAAYLTVGQCARYSQLLGAKEYVDGSHMGGKSTSCLGWTEMEEHRRVWWGVLILDRFLKIQNISAPLALDSPPYETYLPSDDHVFDHAVQSPPPVTIATGLSLEMGLFSRLCQAVFLTSQYFDLLHRFRKYMDHANHLDRNDAAGSNSQDPTDYDQQTSQIRKTIMSLVAASKHEASMRQLEFCSQTAVCYSTILLLQQQSQQHGRHSKIWPESIEAIRNIANMTKRLMQDCGAAQDLVPRLSIFLVSVTYLCLLTVRYGLGPEDVETREDLEREECDRHLSDFLEMISQRWSLAGAYMEALRLKKALQEVDAI